LGFEPLNDIWASRVGARYDISRVVSKARVCDDNDGGEGSYNKTINLHIYICLTLYNSSIKKISSAILLSALAHVILILPEVQDSFGW